MAAELCAGNVQCAIKRKEKADVRVRRELGTAGGAAPSDPPFLGCRGTRGHDAAAQTADKCDLAGFLFIYFDKKVPASLSFSCRALPPGTHVS